MNTLRIPDEIQVLSRERAAAFHRLLNIPQPDMVAVGQLWTTYEHLELPNGRLFQTDDPRMIVVLETFDLVDGVMPHVIAAPLSIDTNMASNFDVIISRSHSPLGFDCMAEIWNETPVLVVQFKSCLGVLSPQVIDILSDLAIAKALGEIPHPAVAAWAGPAIHGPDDQRYAFQVDEVEAVSYLGQAATAAIELTVPTQVAARVPVDALRQSLSFNLPIELTKLSRYHIRNRPLVAHAAGSDTEEDRYLVHHEGDEIGFTLELLYRQRQPYTIYAKVHYIAPALGDRSGVIMIRTPVGTWTSPPSILQEGATITIGHDPRFNPDGVQEFTVTIE